MNLRNLSGLLFALVLAIVAIGCSGTGSQTSSSSNPDAIFIGDSLTADWDLKTFFPGKSYVNSGATGQLSSDMLARFKTDVVDRNPRVVLIWAGANDVDASVPLSTVMANLIAMRNQAVGAGIKPILCTIPPENGTFSGFNTTIVDLNTQIASFAASSGTTVADYYSVVVDPATGGLKAAFAADPTHLNAAGYQAITPVAANAIANAK